MKSFFRQMIDAGLILVIAVSALGCALTTPVQKRIDGYSKSVKDDSPRGWREEEHKPQSAYIPLLFVTVPLDIAIFPIQLPFVGCIWKFYDVQFCDPGEHDSPDLNGLAMR